MYKIEIWGVRGVVAQEAPTKTQANLIAARARSDTKVMQTNVIFPNGSIRICRNRNFKA